MSVSAIFGVNGTRAQMNESDKMKHVQGGGLAARQWYRFVVFSPGFIAIFLKFEVGFGLRVLTKLASSQSE